MSLNLTWCKRAPLNVKPEEHLATLTNVIAAALDRLPQPHSDRRLPEALYVSAHTMEFVVAQPQFEAAETPLPPNAVTGVIGDLYGLPVHLNRGLSPDVIMVRNTAGFVSILLTNQRIDLP